MSTAHWSAGRHSRQMNLPASSPRRPRPSADYRGNSPLMITFLFILLILVSIFLVMVILVQRGRGGGLSGAFGSGGGSSSAFGTKTGDVFTILTVVTFVVFIVLAIVLSFQFKFISP